MSLYLLVDFVDGRYSCLCGSDGYFFGVIKIVGDNRFIELSNVINFHILCLILIKSSKADDQIYKGNTF
jgi:hypothetical protein